LCGSIQTMEIDSRFMDPQAGLQSRLPAKQSRVDWVDVQLTRTFMANARTAVLASFVGLTMIISVLYGSVPTVWLMVWTFLVLGLMVYRQWILKLYLQHHTRAKADALNKFFRRHQWSWPVSAVTWAGLMFLYLDKVPLTNQFICLLVLVGMGAFSITLMSARMSCFRPYVHCLSVTCVVAVVASWYKEGHWNVESADFAMAVLIATFWGLVLRSGQRYHNMQRRGYELQYDNERLIESLRDQTETAKQAVTVKNNLLANAAHDLRQPVHALAFYADWLRSEPELAAEVVPKILLATDSVNTLFNSLFDFARIEAGGVQPHFVAVPVCEIANDLMLQFSPAAQTRAIALRRRITPGYVWTDPVLIRRILGNLMANAVRYTERGGVLLTSRLRGDEMWIEVWDTGVGIAPEHQDKVFKEFYKASTHQGTEDGFGLGLAIVERLCSVLGHKVTMLSSSGRGTCMRLTVKLAKLQGTEAKQPPILQ
jgi:signal transduction histidine kinase